MVWGLVISAISTIASARSSRKASKAQRRSNDAQRRINRLKNKQARRQFLRQFRQAQGATLQQGIASGLGIESSSVQGALASQGTQAGTAVSEFETMDRLGAAQTAAMNAQSSAQFKAQAWGQAASLASQFISFDFNKGTQNPEPPTASKLPKGP